MLPEQARGEAIDQRSDLFSLGVMLYRLCTGRLPFNGPNTIAFLTALAIDTPAPVRQLNPQASGLPYLLDLRLTELGPGGGSGRRRGRGGGPD
jgi:serine/threonine protein kinase